MIDSVTFLNTDEVEDGNCIGCVPYTKTFNEKEKKMIEENINGVIYAQVNEIKSGSCFGCVADEDTELCRKIGSEKCVGTSLIFNKRENKMEKVIDGVAYVQVSEKENDNCEGCVGDLDKKLCQKLDNNFCDDNNLIYIKKENKMENISVLVQECAIGLFQRRLFNAVKNEYVEKQFDDYIDECMSDINDPDILTLVENNLNIPSDYKRGFMESKIEADCAKYVNWFKDRGTGNNSHYNGIAEVPKQARTILEEYLKNVVISNYSVRISDDNLNKFYSVLDSKMCVPVSDFIRKCIDDCPQKYVDEMVEKIVVLEMDKMFRDI